MEKKHPRPPTNLALRAVLTRLSGVRPSYKLRKPFGHPDRFNAYDVEEPPSHRYPEATEIARSAEWKQKMGPCPEDVDFIFDKTRHAFKTSVIASLPIDSFAVLFDAAQDADGWRAYIKREYPIRKIKKKARTETAGAAGSAT